MTVSPAGRKQSSFLPATTPLTGDEQLDLIQSGRNRRATLTTLLASAVRIAGDQENIAGKKALAGGHLRTGYDAPGPGADAALSVNGSVSVLGTAEHRIWANNPGQNVLSIRNTHSAAPADSAVKFLDAATGLERGAIGFHNGTFVGDTPFDDTYFIESSRYIQADGQLLPLTQPMQPLRMVTTGFLEGFGWGAYCRIGLEADGSTKLYYPTQVFSEAVAAVNIPADFSAVELRSRVKVIATTGNEQLQLGDVLSASIGKRVTIGYDFGTDSGVVAAYHGGTGVKPLRLQPAGGMVHFNVPSFGPEGATMQPNEAVMWLQSPTNLRIEVKRADGSFAGASIPLS